MDEINTDDLFNFNVGILGHVDSGKTCLARAVSTTASTASFDKNPQSQERGITLDLGFSSAVLEVPRHLADSGKKYVQYTFVDCPGHASLIRTIIGGSQIIDLMLLVVDVLKGVQTQTAECLVIGEVTCRKMIVVLNKIDLLSPEKREATIQKISKKMKLTLEGSVFRDAPVVSVAAKPGGTEALQSNAPIGLQGLMETLKGLTFLPQRDSSLPFLMAVDHCFPIRGKGSVLTGTVLQGAVRVGDVVEVASLGLARKVRSLQMFRRPVEQAGQGDRLGMCLTQLDPGALERGMVCLPGSVPSVRLAVAAVSRIQYFKGAVRSKARLHVILGHDTVMARLTVFGEPGAGLEGFHPSREYRYQEELSERPQLVLLEFQRPVLMPPRSVVIGCRLDEDVHTNACRLAFQGHVEAQLANAGTLQIYKEKSRVGCVQRAASQDEVVVAGLFQNHTKSQQFLGLKVQLSTGEEGVLTSTFGQGGKVKVQVPGGLLQSTLDRLASKKGRRSAPEGTVAAEPVRATLHFRRYVYDPLKRIVQAS
ncbi:selenocysteine-specific elongation factor isoform X2 [Bacillus rossius redtenbacheri]|uniref:selenocysteine-specific elongation factor isoform X2 n=1 Tax=Bacillus rossius redtenbacheri TaxID=93214 RepID=UPI002FDD031E